ncbi:MAG: hypothetical protein AAFR07_05815 [Pseudomonadota bacterium]
MTRRPQGMVMLMALIMLTMLGLMSASALRGTGISALDVRWQSDAILVEETVEQNLRHTVRNFAVDQTPIDATVLHSTGGVRTQTTMTLFEPHAETEHWPASTCAEFRTEGTRGFVTEVQTMLICLPIDSRNRNRLVSWRDVPE